MADKADKKENPTELLQKLQTEDYKPETPEEQKGEPPRRTPPTRKMARLPILNNNPMQRSLFDELERQNEEGTLEMTSKIPSLISDLDFNALLTGAMAVLSDQSYLYHNEEELSGMAKIKVPILGKDNKEVHNGYMGIIDVSLNELCIEGYGYTSADKIQKIHKDGMIKAIEAVNSNAIAIKFPNGDIVECTLINKQLCYVRKSDGARMYRLILNPIFTANSMGFGVVPRGAITLIAQNLKGKKKRLNEAYHKFLLLLAVTRGEVASISLENLLKRLELLDSFKKDRKRTIEKLELLFTTFLEERFILEMPEPIIPEDGMYHIKINKDFMNQKRIEGGTPEEEN